MTISVISATSSYPSNSIGSVAVTTGDLICTDYSYSNTNQTPSVSDNAAGGTNTYTKAGEIGNSGGSTSAFGHSYWAKAKATETLTITWTAESDNGVHVTVYRSTNGFPATPTDGASATSSDSTTSTTHTGGTVSPTAADSIVVHTYWFQESADATLTDNGSSFTKESEVTNHVSQVFDRIVTSASGTYACAVTSSVSTLYNSVTQAYKENAGGSTTTLSPSEGAVTVAGNTPSETLALGPAPAPVIVGGNAPALTSQLGPSTGSVVVGGNAPSLTEQLLPTTGSVVVGGNAPSLTIGTVISPTEGLVSVLGNAPSLNLFLSPTEAQIVLGGQVPRLVIPDQGAVIYYGRFRTEARRVKRTRKSGNRELGELLDRAIEEIREAPPDAQDRAVEITRPFIRHETLDLSRLERNLSALKSLLDLAESVRAAPRFVPSVEDDDDDEDVLLLS